MMTFSRQTMSIILGWLAAWRTHKPTYGRLDQDHRFQSLRALQDAARFSELGMTAPSALWVAYALLLRRSGADLEPATARVKR
jgi:hypothetical protein